MKNLRYIYLVIFLAFTGCSNDEFLDREPTDILAENQVWANDDLVFSVLVDLYNRIPDYQGLENWWEYATFDETFASNAGDYGRHQNQIPCRSQVHPRNGVLRACEANGRCAVDFGASGI